MWRQWRIFPQVDAKDVYEGRSSELAKNLLSLDDALLLDNIEDKNQFGKIFNNITGLKISLPKCEIWSIDYFFQFINYLK